MTKQMKEAFLFCALCLAMTFFVFWGPLAVTQTPAANIHGPSGPWWAIVLLLLGGSTPSLLAIGMTYIKEGRSGLRSLWRDMKFKIDLKWYGYSLLVVFLGALGQILLLAIFDIAWDPTRLYRNIVGLIPLIYLGPISEELGWRGYVLKRFLTRWTALKASIVLGVIWALWHLPLFYIPGTSQNAWDYPFLGFLVGISLTNVLYTVVYVKTGGSIWSAIFLHWIYSYVTGEINGGIARIPMYNWLEYVPFIIVAAGVTVVFWDDLKRRYESLGETVRTGRKAIRARRYGSELYDGGTGGSASRRSTH